MVVRGKGGVPAREAAPAAGAEAAGAAEAAPPHLGAAVAIMHASGDTRTACGVVRFTQVGASSSHSPSRLRHSGAHVDGRLIAAAAPRASVGPPGAD